MFLLTRHEGGPILTPDKNLQWEKEGVFNPGVVLVGDEVVMLYRAVGEKEAYISRIGLAKSKDGIVFERASTEPVFWPKETFDKWATEDPRITQIGEDFYVTYVAVATRIMQDGQPFVGSVPLQTTTALLRTRDFTSFENLGIISPENSDNKDIVLFPRKIGGRYCMLHRPNLWDKTWHEIIKSKGETVTWPYDVETLPEHPGIWIAWSDNLKYWKEHRLLLHSSHHTDAKIGPGLPPIETADGWLIIYHHVITTENKDAFIYSVRAALFDLDDPTKMIGKLPYAILNPEMPYEKEQLSPIVFPTGGYVVDDTLFVYYGASDRYIALATGTLSELLAELKKSKI